MSSWYLRKADGGVYGPAGLGELMSWAADGRIAPEDDLSVDQQDWRPAPSVHELEMHYEVLLQDGSRYGPIHVMALRELMTDGSISSASQIFHAVSKKTKSAGEWLIEALVKQVEETSARLAKAKPEATLPEFDGAAKTESGYKEVLRWKHLYETEKKHRTDLESKYEQQHGELVQQLHALQKDKERLTRKIADLQEQVEQSEFGTSIPVGDADIHDAYRKLSRNYDSLLEQLKGKTEELNELREARGHGTGKSKEIIEELEEQLEIEREQSSKYRKKLGQLEVDHMELVQSYRDLNDRYIRLRQEYPAELTEVLEPDPEEPQPDDSPTAKDATTNKPKIRLT